MNAIFQMALVSENPKICTPKSKNHQKIEKIPEGKVDQVLKDRLMEQ